MKKPKFKFIKQDDEMGCSIACIAMIVGKSYDEVADSFHTDFTKDGIKIECALDYLSSEIDIVRKKHWGYTNRLESNRRMLIPFADIHYVSFQQFADIDSNHAVVMLKNGKIVCPTIKNKLDITKVYQIDDVIGCYYDR